ncbi:MAG: ammonium transporter [Spirochaetaceae bacterium]
MHKRVVVLLVLLGLLVGGGAAFGQFGDPVEVNVENMTLFRDSFDMIWLALGAALVFFMQAGFAMVETGLTRAKNAGNIIMKNLMDAAAGLIVYFIVGYGIMYGTSVGGLFGTDGFFLAMPDGTAMHEVYIDWMFQAVFAATAATIVSGAMAERTQFKGYLVYSVVLTALIYPVVGHWTWGGGFLAELGFADFAGSTIVHSTGGWAALAGAIVLGARKGKYVKKDGKTTVKAIPGHNIPLAALGVFILWFGWFGFNGGSTLSGVDFNIAIVFVTTALSAAGGAVGALILTWFWFGKPDVSMTLNGVLAGLVGITAGPDVISPGWAIIVGIIAGVIVVLSVEFLDKKLHVDDPVGAISVHGVCGAWGTLAVGIFGGGSIVAQIIGVVAVFAWTMVTALILFSILKAAKMLRVSEDEELAGLDISEHGMESYSGFQIFSNM